ncbi:MAG TPA: hypothetical protein VFW33_07460 [Gemmataceae bacterium]|nr:hypothetical protein [Gemmataceae bacterium]
MTEAEWLTCTDPDRMLDHLLGTPPGYADRLLRFFGLARDEGGEGRDLLSERKLRLYAVACCQRLTSLLPDERSRNALEVAARYADGRADEDELGAAHAAARAAAVMNNPAFADERVSVAGGLFVAAGRSQLLAAEAAVEASGPVTRVTEAASLAERAAVEASFDSHHAALWADAIGAAARAALLRELFGNPFRPSAPLPPAVLAWNGATVRRLAEDISERRDFGRLPILADALLDAGCDDEELIRHCRSAEPHLPGCWALDFILGKS